MRREKSTQCGKIGFISHLPTGESPIPPVRLGALNKRYIMHPEAKKLLAEYPNIEMVEALITGL
jgi:hypothetical protein